ncbi:hypothetical protein KA005_00605 [bacterium]|nr:hypothetical protein [bacterium]
MRKLPLLIVEWDDITTDGGWKYDDEDHSDHILGCISVGWQVKSNRRYLIISPMRSAYTHSKRSKCDDRQIIPRGCIRSIRRLE